MYLYVFEDGDVCQSPLPPTEIDKECLRDGYLRVFCLESGNFQEGNARGKWEAVPLGIRLQDPDDSNREYTYPKYFT